MPDESFAESRPITPPAFDIPVGHRLAMVALGYLPLLHTLASIGMAVVVARANGASWGLAAGLLLVYLLPPLAVRLLRPRALLRDQRFPVGSREFLAWWYCAQWQVIFNRLPLLEELLRLVPGLYSAWLRLWGARIGRLVYWSPGLNVFDRPFLEIGSRAVIGMDVKLCPHLIARTDRGTELVLAPISIGEDALIGASALLPAGVRVAAGEQTPAARPMAPFAQFQNGRHTRTVRFLEEPASA